MTGYAAKYNVESDILTERGKQFIEILSPGCFDKTLIENTDIRAYFNHDSKIVMARQKNGSLTLASDEVGLFFDLTMSDTSFNRDKYQEIKDGVYDGCSFYGFLIRDRWDDSNPDGILRHYVDEVSLVEITPACTMPAYSQTEVIARSQEPTPEPKKFIEPLSITDTWLWVQKNKIEKAR